MSMTLHTRESLGVPDWFLAECSVPLPGFGRSLLNRILGFTEGPCAKHDWEYWLGSKEIHMNMLKAKVDRDFRASIKHNAKVVTNHWYEKWKSPVGEAYYWAVVLGGRRNWRLREDEFMGVTLMDLAIEENRFGT